MKDFLKEDMENAIRLCKEKNKSIFFGRPNQPISQKLIWDNFANESDPFEDFMKSFINSSSSVLIVRGKKNSIQLSDEALKEYIQVQEPDKSSLILDSFNIIKENLESIVFYSMGFFDNNVYFEFKKYSKWKTNYIIINKIYTHILEDNNKEERTQLIKKHWEFAEKITSEPTYLKAKNSHEREEIAVSFAEKGKINSYDEQLSIAYKAEKFYDQNIKPKLEAELKTKILELKEKGYSKVKIRGTLGISQNTLEKYYHKN